MIMDSLGFLKTIEPAMKHSSRFSESMDKVAACTRCKKCDESCPYGLPVMNLVKKYASQYQSQRQEYQASLR
jgi:succinate dehydrogenase/fumarate reductase-like Fe-S protein